MTRQDGAAVPCTPQRTLGLSPLRRKLNLSLHLARVLYWSGPRAANWQGRSSLRIAPGHRAHLPGSPARAGPGGALPGRLGSLARAGKKPPPSAPGRWPARGGGPPFAPTPTPRWLPGPYLDGVAAARGGGPPHQLAVELGPRPRAAGLPLSAGGGGPNPRRLGQVEVGRVQAEPDRGPGFASGAHGGRRQQQQQQQQDWPRCPAWSPRGRRHPAAQDPPGRRELSPGCGRRPIRAPRPARLEPAACRRRLWCGTCGGWSRHPTEQELTAPSLGPADPVSAARCALQTSRAGRAKGVPGLSSWRLRRGPGPPHLPTPRSEIS